MTSRRMGPTLSSTIVDGWTKIDIWDIKLFPRLFSAANGLQYSSTRLGFLVFVCVHKIPEAGCRRVVIVVTALIALQSARRRWPPFRVWGSLAGRLSALIKGIVIDDLIRSNGATTRHSVALGIFELCGPGWRGSRHLSRYRLAVGHLSLGTIRRSVGRSVRARSWRSV